MLSKCYIFFLVMPAVLAEFKCHEGKEHCTRLDQCPPLDSAVKARRPMTQELAEKLKTLNCGYEGSHACVICDLSTPEDLPKRSDESTEISSDEDNRPTPDVSNHPNLRLLPENCGEITEDRIIYGNKTQLFQYPWMALLAYQKANSIRNETTLDCGGTIINEWWVLTAAHCVLLPPKGKQLQHVVLGEWNLKQDPDCESWGGDSTICASPIVRVKMDKTVVHPGYLKQKLFDDIALIKLSEPANLGRDFLRAICLPTTPKLQKQKFDKGVVAGWGYTENGWSSDVLLHVRLPVVPNDECQTLYSGFRLSNRQLCAGTKNLDACSGDSGGPLMVTGQNSQGRFVQVQQGIISLGPKLCNINAVKPIPGIYTRVGEYMDWILNTIGE